MTKLESSKNVQNEATKAMDKVKFLYKDVQKFSPGTPEYEEATRKHAIAMAEYQAIKKRGKPIRPATIKQTELIPQQEKPKYTLEDLKRAEEWDGGDGPNNPGAFDRKMKLNNRKLREIKKSLIEQGLLEITEQEKTTTELDKLYPSAKSKTVVEYNGKKYQIRYYPLEQSRTGKTVFEWGHIWELLDDKNNS